MSTIPIITSGCVGNGGRQTVPDEMTVETQHRIGSHLVDTGIGPSGERPRSEQAIIPDQTTAQQQLKHEDEITDFVEQTDFTQSYIVVVVAAAWPSEYSMEIESIERTDAGVRVSIAISSPGEAVADDAAVHSLAIRVTDERKNVPDRVTVEINGERTGTATPD